MSKNTVTYAVTQRLRFIECFIMFNGKADRNALMYYFGISQPQASIDLKMYSEMFPDNVKYSHKDRAYIKKDTFKPNY